MEFKFSYGQQKRNREQFQEMARIIEQYRAGFGEHGGPLNSAYRWTQEDRDDPRPAADLPLAARLQVDRNTEATYESSWAERKKKMAPPPPPPVEEPDEEPERFPARHGPIYGMWSQIVEELEFIIASGEQIEPVTYYKGTNFLY